MARIYQTKSSSGRTISRQEWVHWIATHCVYCGAVTFANGTSLRIDDNVKFEMCPSCSKEVPDFKVDKLIEKARKSGLGPI